MNINELDSYNLADAVKFNDELNPRIWQGSRMRPEVRRKLLAIAKDFKQSLGLSDLEVKDITLSGSNAGYTYTPHSDIDLHLVVDVPRNETDEVYRELFNAKKYQYNDEHNLSIGGYPVELYVQPANQTHHSQGIYSVVNNDWTAIPRKRESTVNDGAVKSKYELMKHRIDSAIDSNDINRLTRTAARIKQMRQAGLDKNGELGPENLAYKMLRTQGLIEKLYTARTAAKDQQLSLQERKKKKKSRVRYGFGGYYTPGFSFGGEAGEGGGDGGGGESMREDATISPYGVSPTTQMFLNEADIDSVLARFFDNCIDFLEIENAPEMVLHHNTDWSESTGSFGQFNPDNNVLHLATSGRHVLDILRTMAHELTHCKQNEKDRLPDNAGETGSWWEDEANAMAGRIMRHWSDEHPEMFKDVSLEESSGYIPTRAQAKDKRFSTALTVDVHPGQTGKEANKMGLQTDAQGRPALLMKEFANQLHEEFAQFDEGVALFEIKMTGKNLRAEAAKTGAIAGMEFEMIVPNVEGGDDDDGQMEADYSYDEGVSSIQEAYDFFYDGDYNSRGDVTRLRERMQNDYYEWLSEQFDSSWDSDESEFVYNYLKENASTEEIAEILGIELDADNYPDTVDQQTYRDATEKVIEASYGNYWYDAARESAQEDFNQNADLESEWLEDNNINTMQDVESNYDINWPHWYSQGGGDRSIEDVANDFQDAIGTDVQASTNYHAGSVDRPSTSSHHYVVEPDGSLEGDDYGDRGLEFVSPPLPIDVILNDLNKVKRWAKSYGCYTNDSTGLHINVSVPDYSRENLDFVKLAILMGDEYVSDSFGRLGAFYAKSAMGMIRDNIRSRPEAVEQALEKMKTHLDTAASKAIHSGVTTKYTSINVKDGHIEFRSPGGDWLDENFDKIENTLLRFTVAMSAAINPEMYREEYLKKLYKLLNPDGIKDEYGDMIEEFAKYMTSLQGDGKEAGGKLSKETQQAIKDFRKVAAQELQQKNLANKLKKGDTGGQRYWWNVSWGNGRVEVVATTKEEAIDKAFNESYWAPDEPNTPQAIQFRGSLRAKPLSPYYEKSKPSIWKVYGSNSSPYQRLGVEVVATDEFEAMQKARQKWNLNVGGRTEEEFFSTNGWSAERVGDVPTEQTTKYEIYNRQTGNSVENAPDRVTNEAEAIAHLEDYFQHGPHGLQPTQAARMFSIRPVRRQEPAGRATSSGREYQIFDPSSQHTAVAFLAPNDEAALARLEQYRRNHPDDFYSVRTADGLELVDIDIPMAQGRAATSPTGQWKIVDGLNRELYRFRPAENTRAKANELASLWARENNFDGNYQVEPAEDTAPAPTPDQQQGGLIDIAGSTNDLARQRATPGTFTGAWKIIDNDGNEMHRFSGIGNDQRDANRVATQWVQNNGYAYGTEIEVVPIMSESIAEGADKKYTIKKSYTMSKAGVEKSVWHIMDGDFVVDVTDLRRDAKYYADKWNAAEKESSNASQNLHKRGIAEGISNSPQTVTRIDSQKIKDFGSNLKNYKHTDDWSQSGIDTGDDSYWQKKNLKTNATKGLFAGDPHRTALYATGNAHETRYVEFTRNGQPVVYFDQKDLPKMRGRKTYLTVFDAANFRKLPTGEYFSENPGTPLKQTEISDPFQYIASQGWIVRVTHNLNKVFNQVQSMHKTGKIQQYGAEGMAEGINQDVAEGSDSNLSYQGNCTEDDVIEHIFGDVNNFANMVEEHGDEFTVGDLVVKYDPETDVHSFYYKKQGVAEGIEFFAMPLRMSEYRGKTHPATNEPYDSKFKFSGDLKDRVHSLLDAGTKPTLLQVNPRHLLATQDWLSTQGGGKPPFATMKQHPVVLQKNNKLYILDGHHRSADAHKSGTPIQVYLFKDEL
jgi:hypothetical protein